MRLILTAGLLLFWGDEYIQATNDARWHLNSCGDFCHAFKFILVHTQDLRDKVARTTFIFMSVDNANQVSTAFSSLSLLVG